MKIFKMYREEPFEWIETTLEEQKEKLLGYYKDIDLIRKALNEGALIKTPWALYSKKKVKI